MPKLTNRLVESSVNTGAGVLYIRDETLKGFGVKLLPTGGKVYFVEYRMPGGRAAAKGRIVLGKHGSPLNAETARQKAKVTLDDVSKGINPMAKKRDAVPEPDMRFENYVQTFLKDHVQRRNLRSDGNYVVALQKHAAPLNKKALDSITRREISGLLNKVAEKWPGAAVNVHGSLRKIFRWAVGRGDLEISPMTDMQPQPRVAGRERVLSDVELRALWLATTNEISGAAIRLLILTGQRRNEVHGMARSEIEGYGDAAIWTIPAARAKNNKSHIVPLTANMLAEIASVKTEDGLLFTTNGETAFSGFSRVKRRLDKNMLALLRKDNQKATLPSWRLHDLRRTTSTGFQKLGVRFEVNEAILNHSIGGVAGVYQRHTWAVEKRAALEAWGRHVQTIVAGVAVPGNVLAFAVPAPKGIAP